MLSIHGDEINVPVHPAARIFPLLDSERLLELAQDIDAHGQREDVVMLHGLILDGRNRFAACRMLERQPRTREFGSDESDGTDPLAFVLSANLHRRHLSESQRAMVAARMKAAIEEQEAPERRRTKKPAASKEANGRTADRAAKALKVSGASVERATLVQKRGIPELAAAVDADKIPVSTAADIARLPVQRQKELVANADPKVVLAEAKKIRAATAATSRAAKTDKLAAIAHGNGPLLTVTKYPVLYVDPPWKYRDGTTDPSRRIDNQYPPMDLADICALPVAELATDAAILFLWATNPLLPEALQVIHAWGFIYKSNFAWDKGVASMGYWVRGAHELLLIATRGDMPTPPENARPPSVIHALRGEHSAKPAVAAHRIEVMYPSLPRIELFARGARPGWSVWGNQADACLECHAGPGERHGDTCDDAGATVPPAEVDR